MSMKVFVIIFSVSVVVAFIFSCYLMTLVNPAPLVTEKPIQTESIQTESIQTESIQTEKSTEGELDTEKPISTEGESDLENVPGKGHFGELRYGLEQAPTRSEIPVPLPYYIFRKNNPNLLSTQKYSNHKTGYPPNHLSTYSHLHATRTVPMLALQQKTTLQYTCQHYSTQTKVTELPKNNTRNNTDQISHPVKGRRRSIDSLQKRFSGISGSILLKIIDEHGKSAVEIKVNTKDTNTIRNKNSSVDNNSALSDENTPQDFVISLDELPDRTEIRILPNSSLVLSDVSNQFDSKLDNRTENSSDNAQINQQNYKHTSKYDDVKGHNDTIAVISRPGSNGPTAAMTVAVGSTDPIQRTTQSVNQVRKTTSTGDLALKVLFDNVARSFGKETLPHLAPMG